MDKLIKKLSPLTEATFYTLLSLHEPLHGYGIIKKVEAMTNERVKLAAGTLYGVLSTLQKHELIVLEREEESNKKKKIYKITDLGKELIEYEMARLSEMLENARQEVQDE